MHEVEGMIEPLGGWSTRAAVGAPVSTGGAGSLKKNIHACLKEFLSATDPFFGCWAFV